MPINTNPDAIRAVIIPIFSPYVGQLLSQSIYMNKFQVVHGDIPDNIFSNITATNLLNASSTHFTFTNGAWSTPINGVVSMTTPSGGAIKSSGLPVSPAVSFIRLFNSPNLPFFDIPVSLTDTPDTVKVNKTSGLVVNDLVYVTGFKMKLPTTGDFSFNNNLASIFLRAINGTTELVATSSIGVGGYFCFGAGVVTNSSGSASPASTIIDIYDNPTIPNSANDDPTGTLLWRYTVSNLNLVSGKSIFLVVGNTVNLEVPLTANAIASGTPKYIRIYREAITVSNSFYPKIVLQMPVGEGTGYANLDRTSITSGQPVSLLNTPFAIKP